MLFNYHTHTKRCKHAVGEDREYVEKAIEMGIKTLGFSDHAPYLFPDGYQSSFRMYVDELEAYVSSIRSLAKEFEKDIRILCGFELEYYPRFHKDEMAFLKQVQPDYLIMGQHFFGNEIDGGPAPHIDDDQRFQNYISQVIEGLKTGDFLYLAHPDLVGFRCSDETIDSGYRRLCENAKRLHIPLEINMLGMRTNRHYPNERFFKIVGEVGNQVVLGLDAHAPNEICDSASETFAKDMVSAFGLKLIDKPLL